MEPYDASNIALSNELYSQLMQPDLNYTKYVQIISKSEPLLQIMEEREKKQKKQEEQYKIIEEKNGQIAGIVCLIMMLIVIILVILGCSGVFGKDIFK